MYSNTCKDMKRFYIAVKVMMKGKERTQFRYSFFSSYKIVSFKYVFSILFIYVHILSAFILQSILLFHVAII